MHAISVSRFTVASLRAGIIPTVAVSARVGVSVRTSARNPARFALATDDRPARPRCIGHGRFYADEPPVKGLYPRGSRSHLSAAVTMSRLDAQASARA